MFRKATTLLVTVENDPVPGTFHTDDSVQEQVTAMLTHAIPHYNPEVQIAPTYSSSGLDTAQVIEAARLLRSEDGENSEYDRALVEMVMDLTAFDRFEAIAAVLGTNPKAKKITGVDSEGLCRCCGYIKTHEGGCGEPCV